MHHPYQITRVCHSESFGSEGLLLAVCGAQIVSVKLADGSTVSQWPEQSEIEPQNNEAPLEEGPPGKKRKLEQDQAALPNVIRLALTPDHRHAVAVTDDKFVRVFEISGDGKLVDLSQRMMPKRPCAVLVTPDSQTILCADKFGDVYSLPLIPANDKEEPAEVKEPEIKEDAPKKFVPTATNLTVHTGRNRRALENQMRQKDLQAKAKETLKFEHQLLLGHVSMLTDVEFATQEIDGKTRGFIITADRDEHIRISREPPHAYVIERYCLGHKEFISKICLLPGSELLVSGGGDDWLGFWNWQSGDLRQKCDLKGPLMTLLGAPDEAPGFGEGSHVAVSGIWAVPATSDVGQGRQNESAILVASEKLPVLLATPTATSPQISGVKLPGHPLDVAVVGKSIIVSFDVAETPSPRLHAYTVHVAEKQVKLVSDEELNKKLQAANDVAISAPDRKELDGLLYGIENLRKRGGEDGQEG